MKKKLTIIEKDKIKRKTFIKNELKIIIFKSIIQNNNITQIEKSEASRKITFIKKKSFISKQNNICLISSRMGGVFKKFNSSRHVIKRFAKINMLHNVKINSW